MQTIKPMALGLTTRCIEFKRRLGLSVTGSLFFPFTPAGQGTAWTDMSMWKFLGAQMPEGPLIDEGVLKLRSEFLVHGQGHAPGGSSRAFEVRATVAGKEKVLHVFGPRQWVGRRPTEPLPCSVVPLDWRHTYGGSGFAANPLGMGRALPDRPSAERWLPQVVRPQQHPEHPEHEVAPACMRAIDCAWPQRSRHAGTYDDAWLKGQSPGFANDLDWRYFNLAQEDQWLDSPPRGDEPFEFVHMHPTKPLIQGALPGLKARCFVDLGDGKSIRLREVPLQLTTLWFFPEAERGIALFQGLAEVQQDDASDVRVLIGAIERLEEPRPTEYYLKALEQRMDPQKGALYALRESDLLPTGMKGSDPEFDAVQSDYTPEGLIGQAQRRGAALQIDEAISLARAKGVDPEKLGLRLPVPAPVPTLEQLPDFVAAQQAEMLNQQVTALLDATEQAEAALQKAKQAGIDPDSLVPRGPPGYSAAKHLAELDALNARQPGKPPVVDLAAMAPQLLQVEAMARNSYLTAAHTQAPAKPLPPARAAVIRAEVMQAHAAGKSFLGADLTGADLSRLDLRGADFTGAWLESANLSESRLEGASFAYAVLAHADLGAANATQCDFTGANLGKAKLSTTRLVQCNLSGANLSQTALAQTDLRGARLDGVKLLEATYGVADWRVVQGSGLVFIKAALKGMVMVQCRLPQATFIECDLSGVDFTGAQLPKATFLKCKGMESRWTGAVLEGAVFVDGCDFSGADFSEARLSGANLRGARLAGTRFVRAGLDQCDLSEADASEADLSGASLRGSLLIRTGLARARLAGANLMNAILQRADLRGADLQHCNLYGSDISRVWLDDDSRLQGASLERAKTYPRREPPRAA